MLYVGSDDGAYRLAGVRDANGDDTATTEQVLESGAVMRLRRLDDVGSGGLFAATATGLYHSPTGEEWVDLGAPGEAAYAVGASSDGETLYAGTRPAAMYAATVPDDVGTDGIGLAASALEWRECEGFQDLPSREHWRLPRHEDLAHVRDAKGLPGRPEGVVAAVEVGGVHASEDRGETWSERRGPITDPRPEVAGDGDDVDWSARPTDSNEIDWSRRPGDVHDDVHELAVVDAETWIAATGFGLFRTTDAGRSWTRLDDGVDQRYFRTVFHHDGTTYAAGALSSSGNWDAPDEDPGFFAYRPGDSLEPIAYPTPTEVVTGLGAVPTNGVDGAESERTLVAGTHRGSLLRADPADDATDAPDDDGTADDGGGDGAWREVGSFPVGETTGTYTPLAWLDGRVP
ncbi:glycosyl hydrolase [Halorubellus sp. JP-L1]|uniref:WD40/YVTN/BNR-like repeat-containing protein n=1 Tax=Halorubellus sp. JP-L1 TaxID=2715753 RepID=UPI001409FFE8|nr:glycosyl hydrolase [Halorubellus sp. JP-L1]NHN43353.1 glycosyl hydrolase [Halorubellus sp. JP-L1]